MNRLIKIIKFNVHLVLSGSFLNFYRVVLSSNEHSHGQKRILKYAPILLEHAQEGSVEHQTALEIMADVYMRQHRFKEASCGFRSALDLLASYSKNFTSVQRSASYLFVCLASCHFNLGDRDKTIEVITEALKLGIAPERFEGLIDSDKLEEIISLEEAEPGQSESAD